MTQQRIEMALKLFPDSEVRVILADSEILHEGKIDDPEGFLKAIETTKERVIYRYPSVKTSTFFERAGSRNNFMDLRDRFYAYLTSDAASNIEQLLVDEAMSLDKRLRSRGVESIPNFARLKQRVLMNSFAELLAIGELLRSVATPSGLCSNVIVYDQSRVTSLINDGYKYGSQLPEGLAPLPLILANSASTV